MLQKTQYNYLRQLLLHRPAGGHGAYPLCRDCYYEGITFQY